MAKQIEAETLREWLDAQQPVTVLDIRTDEERAQWAIPGSLHLNAHEALRAGQPGVLRDPELGRLIVPIVPDEARTFGMEALFRQVGIYSHVGQLYEPVDARPHIGRPDLWDRPIHSRLPVIPDFPPWAVTIAAARGESIREQTLHAPEVLAAAAKHLQAHQRSITIVTKTVDGVPKDGILREAVALGADRIVPGSHGRGRDQRVILGSTAAAVTAEAGCTVHVVRPRPAGLESSARCHAA